MWAIGDYRHHLEWDGVVERFNRTLKPWSKLQCMGHNGISTFMGSFWLIKCSTRHNRKAAILDHSPTEAVLLPLKFPKNTNMYLTIEMVFSLMVWLARALALKVNQKSQQCYMTRCYNFEAPCRRMCPCLSFYKMTNEKVISAMAWFL